MSRIHNKGLRMGGLTTIAKWRKQTQQGCQEWTILETSGMKAAAGITEI